MICKKCGREYEDDMPNCLWCDAPNAHYKPIEKPEEISLSDIKDLKTDIDSNIFREFCPKESKNITDEHFQEKVAKHPAGSFILCAAILGAGGILSSLLVPFYIAIFHWHELKKNNKVKRFITAYFSIIAVSICFTKSLYECSQSKVLHQRYGHKIDEFIVYIIDNWTPVIYCIIFGYASALLIKYLAPNYSKIEYRKRSLLAILFSIPLMVLSTIYSPQIFN